MRILFDQNVPRALRNLLPGHDVRTAAEMGWSTLANGILVDAAERGGFEAIITADRSIRLQVNISSRRLAVIILSTNHWPALQRGAPAIQQALQQARPGSYQDVAVGRFRRGRSGPPPSPRMHLRLMAARTGKTASGARSDRCESGGAPFAAFGKSPAHAACERRASAMAAFSLAMRSAEPPLSGWATFARRRYSVSASSSDACGRRPSTSCQGR